MRGSSPVCLGLLAAAFVALAGYGGSLYWDRVELRGEKQARAELGPLASKQVPEIFGYDYQTVERSLDDAYPMFTPQFRRQFQEKANANIIPQARDRQMVSQVNVVGFGVMDCAPQLGFGDGVHQPDMDRQVPPASLQRQPDQGRLSAHRRKVADQLD